MPVSLNVFAPSGTVIRVYVNGLATPHKVWFEPSGAAARMRVQARDGSFPGPDAVDLDELVRTVCAVYELDDLVWDEIVQRAGQPARRGRPPKGAPVRATLPGMAAAGGWTHTDAAILDADQMAHPLPAPTELLVDHREPEEIKVGLRRVENLVVREEALDVGDYVVPGVLTIERKAVVDFVRSIQEDSRRLFTQTDRMAMTPGIAVLLLEGDIYGRRALTLPQITGTLSYLTTLQRVSVLPTLSLPHSVYMIVKLVRHAVHGLGYDLGLRGAAPRQIGRTPGFLLEGLPGVSAALAARLLAHFGSVRAVAFADEAELCEVDGIGPTKARQIAEVFAMQFEPATAQVLQPAAFLAEPPTKAKLARKRRAAARVLETGPSA